MFLIYGLQALLVEPFIFFALILPLRTRHAFHVEAYIRENWFYQIGTLLNKFNCFCIKYALPLYCLPGLHEDFLNELGLRSRIVL